MSRSNNVKILILGDAKSAKAAFRSAEAQAKKSMVAITAATAAATGGMLALSKGVIDTSSEFENYGVRLRAVLGSVDKGNQLFDDMVQFAGKVPFAFNDIMASATNLAGVMKGGVSDVNKWMPMIADLAAVSGLSIRETTDQVVRMYSAGAASADLFRERGITAMLGFQTGVHVSAEDTRKQLIAAFESPQSKFRGAALEMAKTWDGLMSMMGDKWALFKKDIGDQGLFDYFKAIAKTINDEIGGSMDDQHKLAKAMSDSIIHYTESAAIGLASVVDAMSGPVDVVSSGLESVWRGYNKMPDWMKEVGLVGAIVGGKKGAAVIAGIAVVVDRLNPSKAQKTADEYARIGKEMRSNRAQLRSVRGDIIPDWMQSSRIKDLNDRYAVLSTQIEGVQKLMVNDGSGKSSGDGSPLFDGTGKGDTARAKVLAFIEGIHKVQAEFQKQNNIGGTNTGGSGSDKPPGKPSGPSPEVVKAMADAKKIIDIHSAKFRQIQILGQAAFADEQDRLLAKQDADIAALDAEQQRMRDAAAAQGASMSEISNLNDYYDQLKIDRAQQTADALAAIDDQATQDKLARIAEGEQAAYDLKAQFQQVVTDNQQVNLGAMASNLAKYAKVSQQWDKFTFDQKLQFASAGLGALSGLMASHSRKQFEAGKIAAQGENAINTYLGATKAYQSLAGIPVVGPFLGAAAAAAVVAAGISNAQKINSAKMGGSTGGVAVPAVSAGGGGATPTAPVSPSTGIPQQNNQQQTSNIVVNLHPQFLDASQVTPENMQAMADSLAPALHDAFGRGQHLAVQGA